MPRSDTNEFLQVIAEFEPVAEIYRQRKPNRVLEIGCWDGGTLKVWLEDAAPYARIAALDMNHRNSDAYEEWRREDVELLCYTGDSQTEQAKTWVRENGPFDWLFIDGDHGAGAVRSDFEMCKDAAAEGAIILLHDIAAPVGDPNWNYGTYPPGDLVDELEAHGYTVERFIEHNNDPWAHGIGMVRL